MTGRCSRFYDVACVHSCQVCGKANYASDFTKKEADELIRLEVNTRGTSNMTSVTLLCANCAINTAVTLEAAVLLLKKGNLEVAK